RQFRHSILPPSGPAELDRHVAAFNIPGFAQAFAKCLQVFDAHLRRTGTKETDHRQRLLRARRERPHRRAAEERDEVAPFHSITSSARVSMVGAMSRPSALAVLRLITSSKRVGCSTGRSPGFAPRMILST